MLKMFSVRGKIETTLIVNAGGGYQPISTFNNIPILGDGTGGKVFRHVDGKGKVNDVTITNGGTGYTRANINFFPGGMVQKLVDPFLVYPLLVLVQHLLRILK